MNDQPIYEEKQYLGYNRLSLLRRLMLMLFCFGIYWWKTINDRNGDLFFWLGIGILIVSILLLFILHLRIRVYKDRVELEGLWTTRKVTISLKQIRTIARTRYSKYHLNNPVFNLHWKGLIRFYTEGTEAIEITDSSGVPYRIGTQNPGAFEKALKQATQ